jgi:site-specific DNA recombinase
VVEEELQSAGVSIEYVLSEYPDIPGGKLNKHIKASIAEYEREKIKERLTRGRRWKVKDGHVLVHGRPPCGYKLTEVDGKRMLALHEPEAPIVRLIFQWYTVGDGENGPLSLGEIKDRLIEMGVPTYQDTHGGGRKKKRGYGEWIKTTVAQIMNKRLTPGRFITGGVTRARGKNPREKWITVQVPNIVSRATWEAAQKRKAHNRKMAKRNTRSEYLVARRLRCGACGCTMHGSATSSKSGRRYKYYRCAAAVGQMANIKCDAPYYRADKVDGVVWKWVKSLLTDEKALTEGLQARKMKHKATNKPLRNEQTIIDDLLAENRAKLERALDAYLEGDLLRDLLMERRQGLQKTIDDLEKRRADLATLVEAQTITDEQIQTIVEFAEKVRGALEVADQDFETRRQLIDTLDVQVTLAMEEGKRVVYVQCKLGEGPLSIVSDTIKMPRTRNDSKTPPPNYVLRFTHHLTYRYTSTRTKCASSTRSPFASNHACTNPRSSHMDTSVASNQMVLYPAVISSIWNAASCSLIR